MGDKEIILRFMARFALSGTPPVGAHSSAQSKAAVASQPASTIYLDCGTDMGRTERLIGVCADQGWVVPPFGLSLGLGTFQDTWECTQAGLEFGQEILAKLEAPA